MMKYATHNIIPILLILLTGYMIYADKDGWGWILFVALLYAPFSGCNDDD